MPATRTAAATRRQGMPASGPAACRDESCAAGARARRSAGDLVIERRAMLGELAVEAALVLPGAAEFRIAKQRLPRFGGVVRPARKIGAVGEPGVEERRAVSDIAASFAIASQRFNCRRARASIDSKAVSLMPMTLRRLALRKILEVEEQDRGALPRRQPLDRVAERQRRLAADERRVGKLGIVRQARRARSRRRTRGGGGARRSRGCSRRDAATCRSAPRASTRGVLPEPDQRVLHDVLGLVEAAEHARARSAARRGASRSISRWKAAESPAAIARISPSSAAAASSCLAKGHLALNDRTASMPPPPLNRE